MDNRELDTRNIIPNTVSGDGASISFIEKRLIESIEKKEYPKIRTRFPPEPNGYLHLGHAKSIFFNFGLAEKYAGECNLRFDDTNPSTEDQNYVDMIKHDLQWLGVKWTHCFYASDYFEKFYDYAVQLIKKSAAYVDERTSDEIRQGRGDWYGVGQESPYRHRPIEENLNAFAAMRSGKFDEGKAVLRAKIDMNAANILMRDPILYRIKFVEHHQTKKNWVIFPTYDFAHCLSDAIEGISHSICTLEFQDNRALYDWILDKLEIRPRPYQYEFARLNVEGVVLSKRKLVALVENKVVNGWDDPRMPTLAGFRKKGYPAESLKIFCKRLGISKQDNCVEYSALENCVREVLNEGAPRAMGIVDPIQLTLRNIAPEEKITITIPRHPFHPEYGTRDIVLKRELYISRKDFQPAMTPGYKRLVPGGTVRLRYGYVIRAEHVQYDEQGRLLALEADVDRDSLGKPSEKFLKPRGVIHWISQDHAIGVEFRKYFPLFLPKSSDNASEESMQFNPNSLIIQKGVIDRGCLREMIQEKKPFQLEREGYFCVDLDSINENRTEPILHETISLKNQDKA